jgi:hypothetical protein
MVLAVVVVVVARLLFLSQAMQDESRGVIDCSSKGAVRSPARLVVVVLLLTGIIALIQELVMADMRTHLPQRIIIVAIMNYSPITSTFPNSSPNSRILMKKTTTKTIRHQPPT